MVEGRRQAAVDALDRLDAEAVEWMRRKRAADAEALAIHERLWPAVESGWARRPPRPDEAPLPPEAEGARPLYSAPLRRTCLALLRRHGQLTLRELHILLLLYGFTIAGDGPVKRLADALGYETREGRAVRVRRATYRPATAGPGAGGPASGGPSLGGVERPDPTLGPAPEDWYPSLCSV
jgi:hypothetical protein